MRTIFTYLIRTAYEVQCRGCNGWFNPLRPAEKKQHGPGVCHWT